MIHLVVLTPKGKVVDDDVDAFTVQSAKGPLRISGGYTPIFEMVEDSSTLLIEKGKERKAYAIFYSSLRIEPMKALLCCEGCETGYDIDAARARQSLERAQKRLEQRQDGLDEKRAKASLGRALARLSAKSLSEGNK